MNVIRSIVEESANSEINEKRRNPEKNRKTTIDDFIANVSENNSSFHVRYSNTKEDTAVMPLNPKYKYNNVWGKYMYPYHYWYTKSVDYATEQYLGTDNNLPFAGEMEYVNFYEVDNSYFIVDSENPPTKSEAVALLRKMIASYPSDPFSIRLNELLDEDDQRAIMELYATDRASDYIAPYSWEQTHILLWNFPYNLSGVNPKQMRKLYISVGIYGFVDNRGEGYIHKSEPYQSVFLDKSVFVSKNTFPNKRVRDIDSINRSSISSYINIKNGTFTKKAKYILDTISNNYSDPREVNNPKIAMLMVTMLNHSYGINPQMEKGYMVMMAEWVESFGYEERLHLWMSPASAYINKMMLDSLKALYSYMAINIDWSWDSTVKTLLTKYAKYSTDIQYDAELLAMVEHAGDLLDNIESYLEEQPDSLSPNVIEYANQFYPLLEQKLK